MLHFIRVSTVFQSTRLGVSSIQRVKTLLGRVWCDLSINMILAMNSKAVSDRPNYEDLSEWVILQTINPLHGGYLYVLHIPPLFYLINLQEYGY